MREPAPCMRYQLHVPMAVVRGGGRRLTRVVVAAAARSRMISSCCAASRARARVQKSVSSSTFCCEPGLQRTRRPMLGVPAQRGLQPYPRVGQTQGCARPGTPEPRRPPGGRRSLHVRSVTLPLGCSRWTGCFGRRPSAAGCAGVVGSGRRRDASRAGGLPGRRAGQDQGHGSAGDSSRRSAIGAAVDRPQAPAQDGLVIAVFCRCGPLTPQDRYRLSSMDESR